MKKSQIVSLVAGLICLVIGAILLIRQDQHTMGIAVVLVGIISISNIFINDDKNKKS